MQLMNPQTPEETTALEFFRRVLPEGNYFYALSAIHPLEKIWRDFPFQHIPELVRKILEWSAFGANSYFGLSAFAQGKHQDPTDPEKKQFRVQSNAVCQKALWLDVDCEKPGKPYTTVAAGLQAFKEFLTATGLPLPLLVLSGQGFHIYWTFSQPIETRQWEVLSKILHAVVVHFGFAVDPARTTDQASVLRMPGTLNYGKDGGIRPVQLVEWSKDYAAVDIAQILINLKQQYNLSIQDIHSIDRGSNTYGVAPAPAHIMERFGAVADGYKNPPRDPRPIIQQCQQIRNSGFYGYDNWYNMMTVMRHCIKGEEVVHLLSSQCPEKYSYADTATKYAQTVEGRPSLCSTFDEKNPGVCPSCPFYRNEKVTTPLLLGAPQRNVQTITAPAPVIQGNTESNVVFADAPTQEFFVPPLREFSVIPGKGIVWHKRERIDGAKLTESEILDDDLPGGGDQGGYVWSDIHISDVELYVHGSCIDYADHAFKKSYVIRKQVAGKAPVDIMFPIETALGPQQIVKWLGHHSVLPKKARYNKPMSDFISAYLAAMQNKIPEIKVNKTFGWQDYHDPVSGMAYTGFIVGNTMYTPSGAIRTNLGETCADMAAREYITAGSFDEWKKILDMYRYLDQKEAMLFICAAFAAPFMRFGVGTATNIMMSMWDIDGGHGKSTLLQTINSIWGHPFNLMCDKTDTASARYQVLAARKDLPVCMDELTTMNEEELANLLYNIANGREKRKSLSTGTALAKTGYWNTATFFTANRSLYDVMERYAPQSAATSMRVLEFKSNFHDYSGTETGLYIEQVINALKFHYGHAGRHFIQKCFENPQIFEKLPQRAIAWDSKVRKYSDERFWTYGLALSLEAGKLAQEFGIHNFPMAELEAWTLGQVEALRHRIRTGQRTSVALLVDFLNEHLTSTLMVSAANRPNDSKDSGNVGPLSTDAYIRRFPSQQLHVRIEADTLDTYIASRRLHEWLGRLNIPKSAFLLDLLNLGIIAGTEAKQEYLARNVKALPQGRVTAYKINGLKLAGQSKPDVYDGVSTHDKSD